MSSIKDMFKEYSYRPRKTAGQNFLTDSKVLDQIEAAVDCPEGDILLEVGGGYGTLTERLLKKGRPLAVVEPDHKLFAMLGQRFGNHPEIRWIKGDILKLDLEPFKPEAGKITLVGNIPYYLTTPLITRLLTRYRPLVRRVYLMVQKEVADRMAAGPGTKAYGALSLCAQYYSRTRVLFPVAAKSFRPKPKVESAFIELDLGGPLALDPAGEKNLFALVRAIFQSRRKTLWNSLKSLGKPGESVERALARTGHSPQVRGETLGLEKMMELAKALESE